MKLLKHHEIWRLMRHRLYGFCLFVSLLGLAAETFADDLTAYRLVKGDLLQVAHPASESPVSQAIDIDGNLRLPGIGTVTVQGKTLREAEIALQTHIKDQGMYLTPTVIVSVQQYAPIFVVGDVASPGQQTFFPGLTIGSALAMSSTGDAGVGYAIELSRGHMNLVAQVALLDFEITNATNRAAAIRVAMQGSPLEAVRSMESLQFLDRSNRAWLEAERVEISNTLAFLQKEAQAITTQILLFEERIEVERAKAEIVERELEDARLLHSKGLQTSQQMAALQRRVADVRADLLALETAKAQSSIALIKVQARKDQVLVQRTKELAADLRLAQQQITAARLRRNGLLAQLEVVTAALALTSPNAVGPGFTFTVLSTRPEREKRTGLDLQSPLLPGDTLVVTRAASGASHDG